MRPAIEVAQADRELLIELLELDDEQADLVRRSLAFTAETEALARHREADRLAVVAAWLTPSDRRLARRIPPPLPHRRRVTPGEHCTPAP